ncbi:MAG: CHAT domain-containing protein, partial [Rhodospirillaceae bacterium]
VRLPNTAPLESVELARQETEIYKRIGDRDGEAHAVHQLGDSLFAAGDYAAAMQQLEAAQALFEQLSDREALARIYTSLGRLNRMHGRPEAAIALYEKAIRIQRDVGDTIGEIQSLNATAIALNVLDNPRRANEYYEKAYALALKSTDQAAIDFMRANLAGGLLETGDYARAAELLEQVLSSGGAGAYAGIRHMQLSRAYLHLGKLADARLHADEAVRICADQPTRQPEAYRRRADVRMEQGDLDGALDDARSAITAIETQRAKLVPADFMKQGYSAYYQAIYTLLIGLYERKGEAGRALETAELARSRAFLDLLASRDVKVADTAGPGASARPLQVEELVATVRRSAATMVSYWVGDESTFVWVVAPDGAVRMKRVGVTRKRLDELVEAVTAPESARAAAMLASRGLPAAAAGGPQGSRGPESAGPAVPPTRHPLRDLYALLVAPIKAALPPPGAHLIVVPHGPLQRLSFAALEDARGRYLLEDYAIAYTPAGALLNLTAGAPEQPAAPRSYLFVADPRLPPPSAGEKRLTPLPGARTEVQAVAKLVTASHAATLLVGPDADKDTVVGALGGSAVVHFATHGVTRDDEPLDSYLALGRGAAGGNGRLTAKELYAARLDADLVVLASCQSGGGKPSGDGLSALARAFFYAGARSVVASVWDVPDEAASRFMPLFYRSWLGGKTKVDALRAAQLRLLGDLRAGRVKVKTPAGEFALPEHPSLWAGFILLGPS